MHDELKIISTGTGRCGTAYMAKLLTSVGIPCGHESLFTNKGISEYKYRILNRKKIKFSDCTMSVMEPWTDPKSIVADSSYMAAPFLNLFECKLIHLFRDPIKVISSFFYVLKYFRYPKQFNLDIEGEYQDFIKKHCEFCFYEKLKPIDRVAVYFIEWNNMIEKKSVNKKIFLYNIEDDPKNLFDFLEIDPLNYIKDANINSWVEKDSKRKLIDFNMIDIKYQKKIKIICDKFNYKLKKYV